MQFIKSDINLNFIGRRMLAFYFSIALIELYPCEMTFKGPRHVKMLSLNRTQLVYGPNALCRSFLFNDLKSQSFQNASSCIFST